jgi:hypothetical protein
VQSAGLLAFSVCWVAVFDYMCFMFTCNWNSGGTHVRFTEISESSGIHHIAVLCIALHTALHCTMLPVLDSITQRKRRTEHPAVLVQQCNEATLASA